jgi:hypothetical protein
MQKPVFSVASLHMVNNGSRQNKVVTQSSDYRPVHFINQRATITAFHRPISGQVNMSKHRLNKSAVTRNHRSNGVIA